MDGQIKAYKNKGLVPCGGTIILKNLFHYQYLDGFVDILIHLNTHPLMFVPPHHSQVLQGRPMYIALCIHGC